MLSLSCPAASSVSLEGKNIWILQSVPLPFRTFLNSKIAVTLSLHAVGYLTALPVFILRFRLDGVRLAALIVVPAVYSVFTAVQGICINCCFPRFDWDNEMVVIKQSMAVILSGVTGMLCVAVPALLHWFSGCPSEWYCGDGQVFYYVCRGCCIGKPVRPKLSKWRYES